MKDRLKFRAWNGIDMFNVANLVFNDDGSVWKAIGYDGKKVKEEHHTLAVTQWTGRSDKNGTPIYEGDIVMLEKLKNSDSEGAQVVRWSKVGFKPKDIKVQLRVLVIGNVFENNELAPMNQRHLGNT